MTIFSAFLEFLLIGILLGAALMFILILVSANHPDDRR